MCDPARLAMDRFVRGRTDRVEIRQDLVQFHDGHQQTLTLSAERSLAQDEERV
jgi:hypothetical protein